MECHVDGDGDLDRFGARRLRWTRWDDAMAARPSVAPRGVGGRALADRTVPKEAGAPPLHVLVVDDDVVMHKAVRRALERAGISAHVFCAVCAADALLALDTVRWDCILLDNRMPDRDGIEILPDLVDRDPTTAVVLMSDLMDDHLAAAAIRHGAAEYVRKSELAERSVDRLVLSLAETTRLRRSTEDTRQNLARTEERLIKAQRLARIATCERDLRTGETVWSDSLYEMLGLTPADVLPCLDAMLAMVPRDDQPTVRTMVDRALSAEGPITFEHRMLRACGRPIHVRHAIETERDSDGTALRLVSVVQDVTESRSGADQLRDVMESVSDAIASWDSDGCLVAWNEAWSRLHADDATPVRPGLRFEDFVRDQAEHGFPCAIDGPVETWVKDRISRFWRGGTKEVSDRDGRWWRRTERPTPDGGVVQVLSDITELKRRELDLAASEQELRDLVEGSLQGVVVSDDRLLFANQAAAEIFGYPTVDALLAVPSVSDLAHPEDRVWMRAYRDARKAGGEAPSTYQFRSLRPDGSTVWIQRHVRLVQWRGRECFQSTYVDVTEAREATARVEDVAQLVRQDPSPVFRIDADGRLLMGNPATAALLAHWETDVGGRVPESWRIHVERSIGEGVTGEFEEHIGESTFLLKMVPIRDAGCVNVYGTDITAHRRTEAALHRAQRLEALGTLTGGIAHDFNNLLTIVMGSLDMLHDLVPEASNARSLSDAAVRACERGVDLTRRLLAFARCQTLRPSRVDANALLGDIVEMLGRTIGGEVDLRFFPGALPGPLSVDAALLESAVVNLAVNARDAMPEGGRLAIETKLVTLGPREDQADQPGPGDYVTVSVSDTGHGIPKDVLDRIFEPFFTTKERGRGSGLGLSMVFGFARQSGGHLTVYSEPGLGTTVRLYLPVGDGDDEATDTTVPEIRSLATTGNGETILVAEDDEDVRNVVRQQLEAVGYRVLVAANAVEAEAVIDSGESPDLLFSDIVMPGGRFGHELAAWASERAPGMRVLLTSGFAPDVVDRSKLEQLGVELLPKPYRWDELATRIRRSLDDAGAAADLGA